MAELRAKFWENLPLEQLNKAPSGRLCAMAAVCAALSSWKMRTRSRFISPISYALCLMAKHVAVLIIKIVMLKCRTVGRLHLKVYKKLNGYQPAAPIACASRTSPYCRGTRWFQAIRTVFMRREFQRAAGPEARKASLLRTMKSILWQTHSHKIGIKAMNRKIILDSVTLFV